MTNIHVTSNTIDIKTFFIEIGSIISRMINDFYINIESEIKNDDKIYSISYENLIINIESKFEEFDKNKDVISTKISDLSLLFFELYAMDIHNFSKNGINFTFSYKINNKPSYKDVLVQNTNNDTVQILKNPHISVEKIPSSNKCTVICNIYDDYINEKKKCKNNHAHSIKEFVISPCINYNSCTKSKCLYRHQDQDIKEIKINVQKFIDNIIDNKGKIFELCTDSSHLNYKSNGKCNRIHCSEDINFNNINKCKHADECKNINYNCIFNHNEKYTDYCERIDMIIETLK
jgi:hypothetical protein